jgi:hypothetical protein
MSNFIVEQERGTYTGRRHPNNGYYALTGPTARTRVPRNLTASTARPVSDATRPSGNSAGGREALFGSGVQLDARAAGRPTSSVL